MQTETKEPFESPAEKSGRLMPQRLSLVDQTVQIMRQLIADGQWVESLPGEEALRSHFGISRVTLRKALAQLGAQGWIASPGRGRKHLITSSQGVLAPDRAHERTVKWLSPHPEIDLVWSTRIGYEEVRKSLFAAGLRLDWVSAGALYQARPEPRLERLKEEAGTAGWVLFRASAAMQRWFQESRLPCVVVGPCHEGVALPNVQVDVEALGYHLGSEASRLGHRHLAFLVTNPELASAIATCAGLAKSTPPAGQARRLTVIQDDLTVPGLRRALSEAMADRDRATLILVAEASAALPTLGILRELGLRVPEDVSVVVRDHEPFLERSVPAICRYSYDWMRVGRSISRVLREVIEGGCGKAIQRKLLPNFIAGETMARVRVE